MDKGYNYRTQSEYAKESLEQLIKDRGIKNKEYEICDRIKLKRKKLTFGTIEAISHLNGKTSYEIRLDSGVWLKYVKAKEIKGIK